MYFLSQVNRNGRAPCWTIGRHKTSFFNLFCLAAARWADDAKACACVVKYLFRGGDAACFRTATAWRRNIFYGKTLHSLRWQPETDECVSATGFVKMLVRILTSCKNRVKSSYKQKRRGKSIATSASNVIQRDEESKSDGGGYAAVRAAAHDAT